MPHRIRLTERHQQTLSAAVDETGMSQRDLAKYVGGGMTQPILVRALNGDRKTIDASLLDRLATALLILLKNRKKENLLSVGFPESDVFDGLTEMTSGRLDQKIEYVAPGSPVPSTAPYYVRRTIDDELDSLLQKPAFTTCLTGPPDTGKTSALLRLIINARAAGFEVVYFDCQTIRYMNVKAERAVRAVDACCVDLAALMSAEFGLRQPSRVKNLHTFKVWLREAISAQAQMRRLLVIDHLLALGKTAALILLDELVRPVHNDRTADHYPAPSILVEAIGGVSGLEEWIEISSASHVMNPKLKTEFFSHSEVERFLDAVETKVSVEQVWNHSNGQPMLTHAAAQCDEEAFARYRERHLETMRNLVRGMGTKAKNQIQLIAQGHKSQNSRLIDAGIVDVITGKLAIEDYAKLASA
jgi:hypothetical protein